MDYDLKIADTRSELEFWQNAENNYPKEVEGDNHDNL